MPDDLTDVSSATWFKDVRARLSQFADQPADAAATTDGGQVAHDLGALLQEAAALAAPGAQGGLAPQSAHAEVDSFDTLVMRARDLGLEVRPARPLRKLDAAHLPALMPTSARHGRLIVARRGDEFRLQARGESYTMTLRELCAEGEGSVIPLHAAPSHEDAAEPHAAPAARVNGPLRRMIRHMVRTRFALLCNLIVAAALSNLMLLAMPVYSGLVFDRVIPHGAFDTLWAVSIGVVLALATDLAVRYVRLKLQDALAASTSATMQDKQVRALLGTRMADAPRSPGAVAMRMREIENLSQTVPQLIVSVAVDLPFLVLVFALIWLNGGIVVLAPMLGAACVAVVHRVAHAKSARDQVRSTKLLQFRTNQIIETVDGLERVKTTRVESRLIARLGNAHDEFAHASHVARLWQGVASYSSLSIGQMMVVLTMMIGVYQISAGDMTIGGLSACTLLVGRVISPIGQLVAVLHRASQITTDYDAMREAEPGEAEQGAAAAVVLPAPAVRSLRLEGVGVTYPGQSAPQLDKASLVIRAGEKVAIIGRSGSGKSTLLKLFTRLVDPQTGTFLVDDFDARHYAPADLRRQVAYMSQTPSLVDDTLLANLTLGLDGVDPARLEAVVRLSGVMDFVARHPKGYGMPVGPRGERLSGGERQSVSLARLLLAEPKVLVLDEPTASMDPTLESRLVKDMRSEVAARTLIIATHRVSMLDLVDRVIWLDGGRIAADGPKADVLARLSKAA